MTAAEEQRLADSFRVSMASGLRGTEQAVALLWDAFMPQDPARFLAAAVDVLSDAHTATASAALAYYDEARNVAGLGALTIDPEPTTARVAQILASLNATGPAYVRRQMDKGVSEAQALANARAQIQRSARRLALFGARNAVVDTTSIDPDATAWSRVSDGGPCSFCAMLVSRGPVYTEHTVRFRAHDGCSCIARPVFKSSPDNGWSPQARAMRDLYDRVNAGETEFANFRDAVDSVRRGEYSTAA